MAHFTLTTEIDAPIDRCFDLSRDIDVHVASMKTSGERAIAGVRHGRIGLGEEVTWLARHFGVQWRMTSRIVEFEYPKRFVDEMQRGPFACWRHEHHFKTPSVGRTTMVDVVDYRSPFGALGRVVDAWALERYMRKLLELRNSHIKIEAERR
jgi:ligand-binding SRPBCC domain-containing protein